MRSNTEPEREEFPPFYRQLEFFDPNAVDPHVTIIGAGGIGSPVALELIQLGVRHLTVYDDDEVAPHNISTTVYRPRDVGKLKVDALGELIQEYAVSPVVYTGIPTPFSGREVPHADVMVSAVDSLSVRRVLFQAAIRAHIPFFVDGRIGGEQIRVYSVQPQVPADRRFYLTTLAETPVPLPCTGQQVDLWDLWPPGLSCGPLQSGSPRGSMSKDSL
jgi:molybdopterin/thiamine biosynthesis adenylyltransferase